MLNHDEYFPHRQIILIMIYLSLICLGIGFFFVNNFYSYFLGIFAGTLFSIIKLFLLTRTLQKSINMNPRKAISYVNLHYCIRFFLTAIFLTACIKRGDISLFGAIIGLIIIRPAIYAAKFIFKIN